MLFKHLFENDKRKEAEELIEQKVALIQQQLNEEKISPLVGTVVLHHFKHVSLYYKHVKSTSLSKEDLEMSLYYITFLHSFLLLFNVPFIEMLSRLNQKDKEQTQAAQERLFLQLTKLFRDNQFTFTMKEEERTALFSDDFGPSIEHFLSLTQQKVNKKTTFLFKQSFQEVILTTRREVTSLIKQNDTLLDDFF